jgi:hypothetical protein
MESRGLADEQKNGRSEWVTPGGAADNTVPIPLARFFIITGYFWVVAGGVDPGEMKR